MKNNLTLYAKDSRLAGPSDGKCYDIKSMISHYKEVGRTFTDKEAKKFTIDNSDINIDAHKSNGL